MASQFSLAAESRQDVGKGASRRLRRSGKVPGVLYGGGEPPAGVVFDANTLLRNMAKEAFLSSILDVNLDGRTLQAVVRDYQVHPSRRAIVHLDLQRIVASEKLRMQVPLHFINETTSKAVKEGGASISHLMTEIEISCLPKDLPGYIEVDVESIGLNEMLHLSDLKLPEGVEIPGLVPGSEQDLPVVHVHVLRMEEEPAAEGAAPAEGAAAPAAAPAAAAEKAAEKPKK